MQLTPAPTIYCDFSRHSRTFLAGIQCFWTNRGMDSRQKHSGMTVYKGMAIKIYIVWLLESTAYPGKFIYNQ